MLIDLHGTQTVSDSNNLYCVYHIILCSTQISLIVQLHLQHQIMFMSKMPTTVMFYIHVMTYNYITF